MGISNKNIYNDHDNTYYDLSKLSFQNINVQIIYGRSDGLDKIHAEKIMITGESGGHAVVKFLRDNGMLLKIINNMIRDLKN